MEQICRYYQQSYERGLELGLPILGHMLHWLNFLVDKCGYVVS